MRAFMRNSEKYIECEGLGINNLIFNRGCDFSRASNIVNEKSLL